MTPVASDEDDRKLSPPCDSDRSVAIIVLNWNNWKDTIETLESILALDYGRYDVILVDNASVDGSVEKILEWASRYRRPQPAEGELPPRDGLQVLELSSENIASRKSLRATATNASRGAQTDLLLVRNKSNLGYTGGNNVGITLALEQLHVDYVLLLNNDTLVDHQFLGRLVSISESDNRIGIAGPAIYDYYHRERLLSAGERVSMWKGRGKWMYPTETLR